jgi:hypothetical protein
MTVAQFVPAVFLAATGKINTFASGSTKWLKIVALGNARIQEWQDWPNIDWNALYLPDTSFGTVTATASYNFPGTVRKISSQEGDVVRIMHTDLVTFTDYDIIPADRQKDNARKMPTFQDNFVQVVGTTLRFNRAFNSTDPQFGGTIYVPSYGFATTISGDSDLIPVDIPAWLVNITAADYCATDVTRQNLVPRLEGRAAGLFTTMKQANAGQVTRIYQPWNPMGNATLPGNGASEAFL